MFSQDLSNLVRRLQLRSLHLDVDRRGEAEAQRRRDQPSCIEGELHAGHVAGERAAEGVGIGRRALAVTLLELHQHEGVVRPGVGRVGGRPVVEDADIGDGHLQV